MSGVRFRWLRLAILVQIWVLSVFSSNLIYAGGVVYFFRLHYIMFVSIESGIYLVCFWITMFVALLNCKYQLLSLLLLLR